MNDRFRVIICNIIGGEGDYFYTPAIRLFIFVFVFSVWTRNHVDFVYIFKEKEKRNVMLRLSTDLNI